MRAVVKEKYKNRMVRVIIIGALSFGIADTSTSLAADAAMSSSRPSVESQPTAPRPLESHRNYSPEAMAQRVEARIKMLHEKFGITKDQEASWAEVAQTMRENEATLSTLIETRQKNAEGMTAPNNLRSYEAIAQARVDGIRRMIASFRVLYAEMSDEQRMNADKSFGRFEGEDGHSSDKNRS